MSEWLKKVRMGFSHGLQNDILAVTRSGSKFLWIAVRAYVCINFSRRISVL